MRNYFNYFTEIEERFQQRRGYPAAALHAGLGADRDVAGGRHSAGSRSCAASMRRSTSMKRDRSGDACAASTGWHGARRR